MIKDDKVMYSTGDVIGDYRISTLLDTGSYSKVYIGISETIPGQKVALKMCNHNVTIEDIDGFKESVDPEITRGRIRKEIAVMKHLSKESSMDSDLSFPGIRSVIERSGFTVIVMDLLLGVTLYDYIMNRERLTEGEARRIFRQLVKAVEQLHRMDVIHRDLKPENIFLTEGGNLKVFDFGLATTYRKGQLFSEYPGSPQYASPEIVMNKKYYGPPVDVWALGVCLYAMLTFRYPWQGKSDRDQLESSARGLWSVRPLEKLGLTENLIDLISNIFVVDPHIRYTIDDIKSDPWFNESCSSL